jgi:antitoxin component YwqK of YwqJK toxin-antitoxin module
MLDKISIFKIEIQFYSHFKHNSMKITQVTLMIMFGFISIIQSQNRTPVRTFHRDKLNGGIFETINQENGDTTRYFSKTGRFIKKSKDNILLLDGHKFAGGGMRCGCEPIKNGYCIEKYRNGNFKSQGKYKCGVKEGTWFFYHESGQISKIITWEKPYEEFASELSLEVGRLKNYYLKNGQYLEFYPNGQLRVKGEYQIVEEYSNTDTLFTLDPETFASTGTIIEGEFWIPRSKKIGAWYLFDESGDFVEVKYHKIDEGNKTRPIKHRYWEMAEETFEEIKKHDAKKLIKDKIPENIKYVSNPREDDFLCFEGIKRAKQDIKKGKLKFCYNMTATSSLRYENDLAELCNTYDLIYENELTSCIAFKNQTEGCYCSFMDKILLEKYGENFKAELHQKADSIFFEKVIKNNLIVKHYNCDERPRLPNESKRWKDYLATIMVDNIAIKKDSGRVEEYAFPLIDLGFVINENGEISDFRINNFAPMAEENRKYKNELYNISVEYVKKNHSKWIPGKIKNKAVSTENNVRIFFKLKE